MSLAMILLCFNQDLPTARFDDLPVAKFVDNLPSAYFDDLPQAIFKKKELDKPIVTQKQVKECCEEKSKINIPKEEPPQNNIVEEQPKRRLFSRLRK